MNTEPTGTELKVCEDIAARQQKGIAKYGQQVSENPTSHKGWLRHAYEEALDHAIYLKQALLTHNDAQEDVIEFMLKAGQECPNSPKIPGQDVRLLRVKLVAEELVELAEGLGVKIAINGGSVQVWHDESIVPNLLLSYDAVLDLTVVTVGAAVAMGLDMQPGWKEVHRSNMTKFIDGHRREDGKWVKGPSYSPANLQPIIDRQIDEAAEKEWERNSVK